MPMIASTWSFSERCNEAAWPGLAAGGDPLDAVVEACRVAEEDPTIDSVGFGGLPDADGDVTVDACVMRSPEECGGVCAMRRHLHAAQVARLVMERTPHHLIAGDGADRFAARHGIEARELVAPDARAAWERWRSAGGDDGEASRQAIDRALRPEDRGPGSAGALFGGRAAGEARWMHHDTIGTIAIGADGRMAGACSTSGVPYKVPGRVGDSPVVGHGLYVDPDAGGATATGTGELIASTCGAFLAVECMRRGASPLDAAREAVARIAAKRAIAPHHQAVIVAVAPDGRAAAAALRAGFLMAVRTPAGPRLEPPGWVARDD
jgi:isoaspartyl peptidase/L-asparaginase-like protein (Ntn-hydrolase superfamily)